MNSVLKIHKTEITKMVSEMEKAVEVILAQRKILEDTSSTLYSMFEDVDQDDDDSDIDYDAITAIDMLPEDVENLELRIDEIKSNIDNIKEGLENG